MLKKFCQAFAKQKRTLFSVLCEDFDMEVFLKKMVLMSKDGTIAQPLYGHKRAGSATNMQQEFHRTSLWYIVYGFLT
jgi:hypothetical protein